LRAVGARTYRALNRAITRNKLVIVGYIGRDAQLQHDHEGNAVCAFPVATNERTRGADASRQRNTTWFRVCIAGQQAEYFSVHLTKGMQVYVEGHLTPREYQDRSGTPRTSLDVRATDVQVLRGTTEEFLPPLIETASAEKEVDEEWLPL
jgi:single-strand DNA-binding protein